MSHARPAPLALLLLTLAPACSLDGGGDGDSTLREKEEDSTSGSEGWDPVVIFVPEPSDTGDTSDTGESEIPSAMDCFNTGPHGVNLGKAADFAILAKSEIAMTPISTVTGNVGISPAPGTFITGLVLNMANTKDHATSFDVVGNIYAADFNPPTPDYLDAVILDMKLAYMDAGSRWPDMTGLGAGDIGGMTLPPGVYNWDADLSISADVGLHGCERDVWIFQVGKNLTIANKASIDLVGGAEARNVFWQVGGVVDIGEAAHFEGTVLTRGSATLQLGASIDGRLLGQSDVSLETSTVVRPE